VALSCYWRRFENAGWLAGMDMFCPCGPEALGILLRPRHATPNTRLETVAQNRGIRVSDAGLCSPFQMFFFQSAISLSLPQLYVWNPEVCVRVGPRGGGGGVCVCEPH